MNITLRNLKTARFASHETLCFEATVYIDGEVAFLAQNDGCGGSHCYAGNQTLIEAAEEWASAQPEAEGFEDLDAHISSLIHIPANVLQELNDLPVGYETPNREGVDNHYEGWTASVVRPKSGLWVVYVCWNSEVMGTEPFKLQREFTKARFAAEFIEGLSSGSSLQSAVAERIMTKIDRMGR